MELLKKYGPIIALVVAPIFLILVAVFAPEQFDRVLESLGLLAAGLFGGAGAASVRRPRINKEDKGFIRLDVLLGIVVVALAMALALGGCAATQRCPDGDRILVSHKTSAPSSVIAKCSSEDFNRVRLGSSAALELFGTCGPGKVPVLIGTKPVDCGKSTPCLTSRFTCKAKP